MSKNPKHNKRTTQMKKYARRRRRFKIRRGYLLVGGIMGLVLIGSVIAIIMANQPKPLSVEFGDTVKVQYTLWTADGNWIKIEQKDEGEMNILVKETATETGLIFGFWYALLDMFEGEIKDAVLLPACVDDLQPSTEYEIHPLAVAGDGWDDQFAPGVEKCQSYGNGELRYTNLIFRIEILEISKP